MIYFLSKTLILLGTCILSMSAVANTTTADQLNKPLSIEFSNLQGKWLKIEVDCRVLQKNKETGKETEYTCHSYGEQNQKYPEINNVMKIFDTIIRNHIYVGADYYLGADGGYSFGGYYAFYGANHLFKCSLDKMDEDDPKIEPKKVKVTFRSIDEKYLENADTFRSTPADLGIIGCELLP